MTLTSLAPLGRSAAQRLAHRRGLVDQIIGVVGVDLLFRLEP